MQTLDDEMNFGRQVARIARFWRTELDRRLKPVGLSQARYVVLVLVAESGGLSQFEIAERAGIRGPTLVRQLDQLTLDGLVLRVDVPGDRRTNRVEITDAGRELLDKARAVSLALRREALAGDAPADVRRTYDHLATIEQRLRRIMETA